ncbi:MAG: hypothetical protein QOH15_599 [Gaiellales bacterium]|jgi:hypothetical protein|nr:hypothetical protein [Gaiellales bacterium]
MPLCQGSEHVEAVEVGQQQIEHHEIPLVCCDALERLASIAGDRRVIPGSFKPARNESRKKRLVFGDQDVHGMRTRWRPYHLRAAAIMTA